jgi:putative SOS response-associated peptidase YedK
MCGRYTLTLDIAAIADELGLSGEQPVLAPRYNIAPTQDAAVVTDRYPERVTLFRWGYVPHWAKDVREGAKHINARAETVAEKPTFRDALARRRCLVVADGFYEWRREGKTKTPMYIRPEAGGVLTFAGLWSTWRPSAEKDEILRSFAILTTDAVGIVRPIHDRMPLVLGAEERAIWLDRARPVTELLPLLAPRDPALAAHAVSPLVNTPANDVPACTAPARVDA